MYGMTKAKIEQAKYKIKCNKAFMKSHGIELDNKIIPFSDFVSNSYINSDRYIAELQHRAHSIADYAQIKKLSNIFLTLTLPSTWHPMKQKSKKDKTLIFNKRFGGRKYITKIVNPLTGEVLKLLNSKDMIKKYQPNNASKELSKMLKRLQDDRSYKEIDKDDRCYFRVTEPHKDGTPHLHISFFMPENNIQRFVNAINRLYPAPASKIELNVDSPVHYLMKYILKTLDDLRDDNDKITSLTLWYIYHGISRFYTSRTFLSLEIYRKLKGMYSLNELKEGYDNSDINIYFYKDTKDIAMIKNEFGSIYIPKPLYGEFAITKFKKDLEDYAHKKSINLDADIEFPTITRFMFSNPNWRQDMENEENTYFNYEFEPIKIKEIKETPIILEDKDRKYIVRPPQTKNIEINNPLTGEFFTFSLKTKIVYDEIVKQPYQMKNYELENHFNNIDIDDINPARYAVTYNLMLDRGLLQGERFKPSEAYEAVKLF